ncbi:hypothetical protein [Sphingomonas astaxanthinifaciens]|uniref:DUF3618 domain-containing protein n=1 Tax=Sphingomonas astaxanthinifaciens DSM 22298 TaxID=1123267 RepID=A0ABQ5Z5V4_9SPHN|nr:hypothetical protein [Sphingomonas astaxanthinifaciens]GLR46887.1 hypothetical protein GCM10007925_05980 [Sphingomonas astaxanthinifaciens DSM 22298]
MSDAKDIRIARARGQADAAKVRLMATLDEVKARLAPGRLTSDAVQSVKDKGLVVADETVTAVKDRPLMAAGIAAAAAAFIARRPLAAAVGRWLGGDEDDFTNKERAKAGADKE